MLGPVTYMYVGTIGSPDSDQREISKWYYLHEAWGVVTLEADTAWIHKPEQNLTLALGS